MEPHEQPRVPGAGDPTDSSRPHLDVASGGKRHWWFAVCDQWLAGALCLRAARHLVVRRSVYRRDPIGRRALVQRLLIDLESDCISAPDVIVAPKGEALRDDHPRPGLKGGASLVDTHGKTTNVEVPT